MTRLLAFDGPRAPKRFELLWAALQSGGDGKGERTPVVIRKEARLLEALDGISVALHGNGHDPLQQRALVDETMLAVAQEDFELLQTYMEKTPWTPRVSREVVDALDWLSSSAKQP